MTTNDAIYRELINHMFDGVYFVDVERRISFWNAGAERITGYRAEDVIGTHCWDNILVHVDEHGGSMCCNRCPLAATIGDGKPRVVEAYLRHKQGHRVPVRVAAAPFRDGQGRIIGAVESFVDNSARLADLERIRQLEELAYLDALTGVANRRYLQMSLDARLAELHRNDWPFGFVMIDVDDFKRFNDLHGHEIGDAVLLMVARTLTGLCRPFDLIGRWGGEEFGIIVANADAMQTRRVAERARALVEQSGMDHGRERLSVTVSAGAAIARPDDDAHSLVRRADELMYESKSLGRNRVTTETVSDWSESTVPLRVLRTA